MEGLAKRWRLAKENTPGLARGFAESVSQRARGLTGRETQPPVVPVPAGTLPLTTQGDLQGPPYYLRSYGPPPEPWNSGLSPPTRSRLGPVEPSGQIGPNGQHDQTGHSLPSGIDNYTSTVDIQVETTTVVTADSALEAQSNNDTQSSHEIYSDHDTQVNHDEHTGYDEQSGLDTRSNDHEGSDKDVSPTPGTDQTSGAQLDLPGHPGGPTIEPAVVPSAAAASDPPNAQEEASNALMSKLQATLGELGVVTRLVKSKEEEVEQKSLRVNAKEQEVDRKTRQMIVREQQMEQKRVWLDTERERMKRLSKELEEGKSYVAKELEVGRQGVSEDYEKGRRKLATEMHEMDLIRQKHDKEQREIIEGKNAVLKEQKALKERETLIKGVETKSASAVAEAEKLRQAMSDRLAQMNRDLPLNSQKEGQSHDRSEPVSAADPALSWVEPADTPAGQMLNSGISGGDLNTNQPALVTPDEIRSSITNPPGNESDSVIEDMQAWLQMQRAQDREYLAQQQRALVNELQGQSVSQQRELLAEVQGQSAAQQRELASQQRELLAEVQGQVASQQRELVTAVQCQSQGLQSMVDEFGQLTRGLLSSKSPVSTPVTLPVVASCATLTTSVNTQVHSVWSSGVSVAMGRPGTADLGPTRTSSRISSMPLELGRQEPKNGQKDPMQSHVMGSNSEIANLSGVNGSDHIGISTNWPSPVSGQSELVILGQNDYGRNVHWPTNEVCHGNVANTPEQAQDNHSRDGPNGRGTGGDRPPQRPSNGPKPPEESGGENNGGGGDDRRSDKSRGQGGQGGGSEPPGDSGYNLDLQKYPCVVCEKEVGMEGRQCKGCKRWLHIACLGPDGVTIFLQSQLRGPCCERYKPVTIETEKNSLTPVMEKLSAGITLMAESNDRTQSRKVIPVFNGDSLRNFREFTYRVREFIRDNPNVNGKRLAAIVAEKLQGNALEIYRGLKNRKDLTADQILESLDKRFRFKGSKIYLMEPVEWQEELERVVDYEGRMRASARTRYPEGCPERADKDKLMLSLFVSGLLPNLRDKVLSKDPKDYDEAYETAQKWQQYTHNLAKTSDRRDNKGGTQSGLHAAQVPDPGLPANMRTDIAPAVSVPVVPVRTTTGRANTGYVRPTYTAPGQGQPRSLPQWRKVPVQPTPSVIDRVQISAVDAVNSQTQKTRELYTQKYPFDKNNITAAFTDKEGFKRVVTYSFQDSDDFKKWRATQPDREKWKEMFYCTTCGSDRHTHENEWKCPKNAAFPRHHQAAAISAYAEMPPTPYISPTVWEMAKAQQAALQGELCVPLTQMGAPAGLVYAQSTLTGEQSQFEECQDQGEFHAAATQ